KAGNDHVACGFVGGGQQESWYLDPSAAAVLQERSWPNCSVPDDRSDIPVTLLNLLIEFPGLTCQTYEIHSARSRMECRDWGFEHPAVNRFSQPPKVGRRYRHPRNTAWVA